MPNPANKKLYREKNLYRRILKVNMNQMHVNHIIICGETKALARALRRCPNAGKFTLDKLKAMKFLVYPTLFKHILADFKIA